jgi:hypothetical protein
VRWYDKLKAKAFDENAPLFPHSKVKITEDNLSYKKAEEVEPKFWQSGVWYKGSIQEESRRGKF